MGLIDDISRYRINVGVHWGGTLYMGQVVTGGRLEVTALGDEVNECARIQESARDGHYWLQRIWLKGSIPQDAATLGIELDTLVYETIGEMAGASGKAVRDAATIPVTSLTPADRAGR